MGKECSEHVLLLMQDNIDKRLIHVLHVAEDWEKEKTTVGEARKASLGGIAVVNESSNPIITAVLFRWGMS